MTENIVNIEIEKSIIFALIVDSDCRQYVSSICADDFADETHKEIIAAIILLVEKQLPLDHASVAGLVPQHFEYIVKLKNDIVSTVNIKSHLKILKEKSKRRKLSEILLNANSSIIGNDDLDDTINSLFSDLSSQEVSLELVSLKEAVKEFIFDMEEKYEGTKSPGLKLGFKPIDDFVIFEPGDVVLIGGRPSEGKTALVLFMLTRLIKQGYHGLMFSLEMTIIKLIRRIIAAETKINLGKLKEPKGNVNNMQLQSIAQAQKELIKYNCDFVKNINVDVGKLCTLARNKKAIGKLDFIVIDYLQLITHSQKAVNPNYAVAEMSRQLKALAIELQIPIFELSQLSRNPAGRTDKKPVLTDLRDSGAIEQDADVVFFVHNYHKYDKNEPREKLGILVRKNRDGKNFEDIDVNFFGEYQLITEIVESDNGDKWYDK